MCGFERVYCVMCSAGGSVRLSASDAIVVVGGVKNCMYYTLIEML